jgi:hypothetical protein
MLDVKLQIDAERFYRKMELLRQELIPYAVASLEHFAELAVIRLQQTTPRSEADRAHLADTWMFEKSQEDTMTTYVVYSLADAEGQKILNWLEKGTEAHVIPVSKVYGFLHWFDSETGEEVYTKKDVQHPGTQPYEMVERAKVEIQGLMDAYIDATVSSIVNRFNAGGG